METKFSWILPFTGLAVIRKASMIIPFLFSKVRFQEWISLILS